MVTVLSAPAFFVVTTPFAVTVAYFALLLLQVRDLFVVLLGETAALSVTLFPALTEELPEILMR